MHTNQNVFPGFALPFFWQRLCLSWLQLIHILTYVLAQLWLSVCHKCNTSLSFTVSSLWHLLFQNLESINQIYILPRSSSHTLTTEPGSAFTTSLRMKPLTRWALAGLKGKFTLMKISMQYNYENLQLVLKLASVPLKARNSGVSKGVPASSRGSTALLANTKWPNRSDFSARSHH
jgi:hypothetical protein